MDLCFCLAYSLWIQSTCLTKKMDKRDLLNINLDSITSRYLIWKKDYKETVQMKKNKSVAKNHQIKMAEKKNKWIDFKKRNMYVHHYASHTQSQNILSTENPYEDRCFMLTEIHVLTSWIMATALRVAKMLPKATKYPLFWSWQKSPAYCTCQFEKKYMYKSDTVFPRKLIIISSEVFEPRSTPAWCMW